MWQKIDMGCPVAWTRNKAWRWSGRPYIVAAAISFTQFTVGFELLTRGMWGIAITIGPLWFGCGMSKHLPAPPEEVK